MGREVEWWLGAMSVIRGMKHGWEERELDGDPTFSRSKRAGQGRTMGQAAVAAWGQQEGRGQGQKG